MAPAPGTIEALERMNLAIDVRDVLPVVSVPTLVVHQRADPMWPVEHGRYLVQRIPGARYLELDGAEFFPSAPPCAAVAGTGDALLAGGGHAGGS